MVVKHVGKEDIKEAIYNYGNFSLKESLYSLEFIPENQLCNFINYILVTTKNLIIT